MSERAGDRKRIEIMIEMRNGESDQKEEDQDNEIREREWRE